MTSAVVLASAQSAVANAATGPDDEQFQQICERYGGLKREFEPALSAGARTYTASRYPNVESGCFDACKAMLDAGYAFVDVIKTDERRQLRRGYVVDRYAPDPDTGEIVHLGRIEAPTAPVEAVAVGSPMFFGRSIEVELEDGDFNTGGWRTPRIRGRAFGRIEGAFQGVRRVSDGALHGEGRFTLRGAARDVLNGADPVVASCPPRSGL